MLWLYVTSLLLQFVLITTQEIHHRSTMGEYYVDWKALGPCPREKRGTDEILTDVHLTKKNRKLEMTKFSYAILGSNLAWLPNAFSLTFPKACSGFANMLGPIWTELLKEMNTSTKCPTRKGVYEMKGYDVDKLMRHLAFPKQFIYGRYKISIDFLNKKNALIGCSYFIADVLPFWQKKKTQTAD